MSIYTADISKPQIQPAISGVDEVQNRFDLRALARVALVGIVALQSAGCVKEIAKLGVKATIQTASMAVDGVTTILKDVPATRQAAFTALAPQMAALENINKIGVAIDAVQKLDQDGKVLKTAQDARQALNTVHEISKVVETAEQAAGVVEVAQVSNQIAVPLQIDKVTRNIVQLTN